MIALSTIILCTIWASALSGSIYIIQSRYSLWSGFNSPLFWLACFILCFFPLVPIPSLFSSPTLDVNIFQWVDIQSKAQDIHPLFFLPSIPYANTLSFYISALCLFLSSFGLVRFLIQNTKALRLIKNSVTLNHDAPLVIKYQSIFQQRNICVKETQEVISPFVYGLFRSYMVIPKFIHTLSQTHQKYLIEHELTHIKNQDHRVLFLLELISSVFWFHPAFKYFNREFKKSIELRCDSQVIHKNKTNKEEYVTALIQCLKKIQMHTLPKNQQHSFAHFGDPTLNIDFYKKRVTHILSEVPIHIPLKTILSCSLLMALFSTTINAGIVAIGSEKNWSLPVDSLHINSPFSATQKIRNNIPHKGVDLGGQQGDNIYAIQSGKVISADNHTLHSNYGMAILIQHQDGFTSLYAHLNSIDVKPGDHIHSGQRIGTLGSTGKSTGPHLHLELIHNGKHINPINYLVSKPI